MGWPVDLDKSFLLQVFDSLGLQVTKSHLLKDTKGFGLCCGFVTLTSIDHANEAISALNGQPLSLLGVQPKVGGGYGISPNGSLSASMGGGSSSRPY